MADLKKLSAALKPNATIGIVGGGQLGRMLASSAARLGYRTIVLEPGQDCPAAQMCNRHIVAAYDDETALAELAAQCDVVTYEFENVPMDAARVLETSVPLYPPAKALAVSQDRLIEKTFLSDADIDVAPFHNVENEADLAAALSEFDGGVLKTRRFGYDGKGQHVFQNDDQTELGSVLASLGEGPFVLEQRVAFVSEFSVIAARGIDGSVVAYDPATNTHDNGILRRSVVPAVLTESMAQEAQDISGRLLDALDYVGVIGVEFFETGAGLLVNEFAPRVHNSGHWTREACTVSQFEQHIRAVAGLPLGSPERSHDCEMLNLLGHEADDLADLLAIKTAQVTLYGKAEARAGRKMGHVTHLLKAANSHL